MGLLEDVLKALERIPSWKRLQNMPEAVARLEQRIQRLEALLAPASGEQCPKCKTRSLQLISTRPHPTFGALGTLEDSMKCSNCGHTENRLREP